MWMLLVALVETYYYVISVMELSAYRIMAIWNILPKVVPRVNNSREGEYPTLNRPMLNERVERPGYHRTFSYFFKVLM